LCGKDCQEGIYNTLIVSPPGCGKTTLLRDIIRLISSGAHGVTVGVVDERSEIAACYLGIPQNQLGIWTDVLDACPKAIGIPMLIRTMSPKVIAVDEIGGEKDVEAIRAGIYCGCAFVGTVHGETFEELQRKPVYKKMIEQELFQRYLILSGKPHICRVEAIYDEKGRELLHC
jgi:stage III sporulation protein AA